jgi:hypothetical protein
MRALLYVGLTLAALLVAWDLWQASAETSTVPPGAVQSLVVPSR